MRRETRVILGLAGAAALAAAVGLPAHWRIEHTTVIVAHPIAVYDRLANLPRWREWIPWNSDQDPMLFFGFDEAEEGRGATLSWRGERLGSGRLVLTRSDPERGIEYELSMDGNPAPVRGSIAFERIPEGTMVTWTDAGTVGWNPLARAFLPLLEASLKKDIETGLTRLKHKVEVGG